MDKNNSFDHVRAFGNWYRRHQKWRRQDGGGSFRTKSHRHVVSQNLSRLKRTRLEVNISGSNNKYKKQKHSTALSPTHACLRPGPHLRSIHRGEGEPCNVCSVAEQRKIKNKISTHRDCCGLAHHNRRHTHRLQCEVGVSTGTRARFQSTVSSRTRTRAGAAARVSAAHACARGALGRVYVW